MASSFAIFDTVKLFQQVDPVGLMRVFSMIVEKAYDLDTLRLLFDTFSFNQMVPRFTLIDAFGLKKAFGEPKTFGTVRLMPKIFFWKDILKKNSIFWFQVRKKRFSSPMRIPSVLFGTVKLMKF